MIHFTSYELPPQTEYPGWKDSGHKETEMEETIAIWESREMEQMVCEKEE